MIKTELVDNHFEFSVNGIKCGYDGVVVWRINEDGHEESIGSFEDIKFIEQTSHCVVFFSEGLGEYLSFNGEKFGGISTIKFDIIPAHNENLPQMPNGEIWEQICFIIDGEDIIDNLGNWSIETSCFLVQKDDFFKGKLLIGICGCTCGGCSDIVADVDQSENYIFWKVYYARNQDRNTIYIFNKKDYENALNEISNKSARKEEDAGEWASFILSHVKKELLEKIEKGKYYEQYNK